MANPHEATRHDMQQKPSQEFVGGEGHHFRPVVVGVVLPPESDAAVVETDEPIVRERDAVGVPTEVVEHLFGAREGPLGIDDPVDPAQAGEPLRAGAGLGQIGGAAGKGELPGVDRLVKPGEIFRAEHERQRADGKEKRRGTPDPPRAVRGQRATSHQAMQVEMLRQRLSPRVEDRGDPDRAAEMTGIASKGQQRVGRGAEEEAVHHARISLREGIEIVGQGEDHVKVWDGQAARRAGREPALFRERLTLGTVAIPTGVVSEARGAALVTRLPMPAERSGAAGLDREESPVLDRGQTMLLTVGRAMRADDVRQLQSGGRDRDRRAPRGHGAHDSASR